MLNAVSFSHLSENGIQLVGKLGRNDQRLGFANDLLGFPAVDTLGSRIPAGDDALEVLTYNSVFGGAHDGGEQRLFGLQIIRHRSLAVSGITKPSRLPGKNADPALLSEGSSCRSIFP